ncbi:G2/mitotic-specific cyclin S13-6-like isoform X4 [Macadamia integrifolia]|uniref:G2/mitotic-specific cyclin S13-6-like isoform X2 n=1 Tax=Macadamia integrifolia TaxID=60698 RepID=UPI001C532FB8|nr:G2/mitotic-specific cyclin S13-6-like isoform X2 [Macadamia integrifolia]XP_042478951.1 G2/mitotic-specific cyclin S13-6-like isoform X3 [Macadamia integrifolia]XP_042478952.1 G2/mitotic-specific cyclin S13-6-like isoform X4 [Macadamia integrifolia]
MHKLLLQQRILRKPTPKVVNGPVEKKGAVPAKPAQKKFNAKPKTDIATEVGQEQKEDARRENNASEKSSRRKAQTLTSILTARSEDACGLINKSSDPIVNIDTEDVDNHLAMVDYVEDLYKFYKLEEAKEVQVLRSNDTWTFQPVSFGI